MQSNNDERPSTSVNPKAIQPAVTRFVPDPHLVPPKTRIPRKAAVIQPAGGSLPVVVRKEAQIKEEPETETRSQRKDSVKENTPKGKILPAIQTVVTINSMVNTPIEHMHRLPKHEKQKLLQHFSLMPHASKTLEVAQKIKKLSVLLYRPVPKRVLSILEGEGGASTSRPNGHSEQSIGDNRGDQGPVVSHPTPVRRTDDFPPRISLAHLSKEERCLKLQAEKRHAPARDKGPPAKVPKQFPNGTFPKEDKKKKYAPSELPMKVLVGAENYRLHKTCPVNPRILDQVPETVLDFLEVQDMIMLCRHRNNKLVRERVDDPSSSLLVKRLAQLLGTGFEVSETAVITPSSMVATEVWLNGVPRLITLGQGLDRSPEESAEFAYSSCLTALCLMGVVPFEMVRMVQEVEGTRQRDTIDSVIYLCRDRIKEMIVIGNEPQFIPLQMYNGDFDQMPERIFELWRSYVHRLRFKAAKHWQKTIFLPADLRMPLELRTTHDQPILRYWENKLHRPEHRVPRHFTIELCRETANWASLRPESDEMIVFDYEVLDVPSRYGIQPFNRMIVPLFNVMHKPTEFAEDTYKLHHVQQAAAKHYDPVVLLPCRDLMHHKFLVTHLDLCSPWMDDIVRAIGRCWNRRLIIEHRLQLEVFEGKQIWFHVLRAYFEGIPYFFLGATQKFNSPKSILSLCPMGALLLMQMAHMMIIPREWCCLLRRTERESQWSKWVPIIVHACRSRFAAFEALVKNAHFLPLGPLSSASIPLDSPLFPVAETFYHRMRNTGYLYWAKRQLIEVPYLLEIPTERLPDRYFEFTPSFTSLDWSKMRSDEDAMDRFELKELMDFDRMPAPWETLRCKDEPFETLAVLIRTQNTPSHVPMVVDSSPSFSQPQLFEKPLQRAPEVFPGKIETTSSLAPILPYVPQACPPLRRFPPPPAQSEASSFLSNMMVSQDQLGVANQSGPPSYVPVPQAPPASFRGEIRVPVDPFPSAKLCFDSVSDTSLSSSPSHHTSAYQAASQSQQMERMLQAEYMRLYANVSNAEVEWTMRLVRGLAAIIDCQLATKISCVGQDPLILRCQMWFTGLCSWILVVAHHGGRESELFPGAAWTLYRQFIKMAIVPPGLAQFVLKNEKRAPYVLESIRPLLDLLVSMINQFKDKQAASRNRLLDDMRSLSLEEWQMRKIKLPPRLMPNQQERSMFPGIPLAEMTEDEVHEFNRVHGNTPLSQADLVDEDGRNMEAPQKQKKIEAGLKINSSLCRRSTTERGPIDKRLRPAAGILPREEMLETRNETSSGVFDELNIEEEDDWESCSQLFAEPPNENRMESHLTGERPPTVELPWLASRDISSYAPDTPPPMNSDQGGEAQSTEYDDEYLE